jgi:hypothetical protein
MPAEEYHATELHDALLAIAERWVVGEKIPAFNQSNFRERSVWHPPSKTGLGIHLCCTRLKRGEGPPNRKDLSSFAMCSLEHFCRCHTRFTSRTAVGRQGNPRSPSGSWGGQVCNMSDSAR